MQTKTILAVSRLFVSVSKQFPVETQQLLDELFRWLKQTSESLGLPDWNH